jgi:hypothetical protein
VNFELESVEVLFQPEPQKLEVSKKPFSQPRELLRVGRRIVFRKPLWPSGLTENLTRGTGSLFLVSSVLDRYKYKIAVETGRGKDIDS